MGLGTTTETTSAAATAANTGRPPLPEQPAYQGYLYAYPHKTAYRPLEPAVPLAEAWRDEPKDALFLYAHIPYCEMRCGFCNLFTTTGSDSDAHARYLAALATHARIAAEAVGPASFAHAAIGGGTPTLLDPDALVTLFDTIEGAFGVDFHQVPLGIETSPATARPERLAVLKARGVRRVSIGVQSFVEAEAHGAGRPQRADEVDAALDAIRDAGFPVTNIDLMYGLAGQTADTFRHSLDRALGWAPEELFLYPLYVRPLTGLDRTGRRWDDERRALYRAGRDHLRERGYVQHSMRLFRRADAPRPKGEATARYRCQEDGMVGLGAGARSYTRSLHWSTEWGVGRQRVRSILDGYVARTAEAHATVGYGIRVPPAEQRRRHVVQSLLCAEGLSTAYYRERFGTDVFADLPELARLADWGLAVHGDGALTLTDVGFEMSDAIGPWLVSDAIREAMGGFELA